MRTFVINGSIPAPAIKKKRQESIDAEAPFNRSYFFSWNIEFSKVRQSLLLFQTAAIYLELFTAGLFSTGA